MRAAATGRGSPGDHRDLGGDHGGDGQDECGGGVGARGERDTGVVGKAQIHRAGNSSALMLVLRWSDRPAHRAGTVGADGRGQS